MFKIKIALYFFVGLYEGILRSQEKAPARQRESTALHNMKFLLPRSGSGSGSTDPIES